MLTQKKAVKIGAGLQKLLKDMQFQDSQSEKQPIIASLVRLDTVRTSKTSQTAIRGIHYLDSLAFSFEGCVKAPDPTGAAIPIIRDLYNQEFNTQLTARDVRNLVVLQKRH